MAERLDQHSRETVELSDIAQSIVDDPQCFSRLQSPAPQKPTERGAFGRAARSLRICGMSGWLGGSREGGRPSEKRVLTEAIGESDKPKKDWPADNS
jgi:hypothetical protein